jgi:hypothetical protein
MSFFLPTFAGSFQKITNKKTNLMKKLFTSIIVLTFATCSIYAQTETTITIVEASPKKTNSFFLVNFEVPVLVANNEFSDFMSNHFDMKTPNALFGAGISVGRFFSPSKRWAWEYAFVVRGTVNRKKNNIICDWRQVRGALTFSYAIIDNKSFRLSPFAGINFGDNQLYYADMREVGGLDQITDILETSFTSFNLAQMFVGSELGFRFDFKIDEPTTRLNPRFSAYIKWEQAFYNSNWQLERSVIRDIPKLQDNALVFGVSMGF